MANLKLPIISVHGSYFGINYGDILLIRLYTKWIREAYGDNVMINYPLADQRIMKEFSTHRDLTGIFNLCRSKALIYVGGGHFGEPLNNVTHWSKRNFKRHIVVGLIAILFRIPIAIIGLEYGPLTNKIYRFCVLLITKHAKLVVVRNEESKSFLQENGFGKAIVCPDAVLALSEYIKPAKNTNNFCVLLHLMGIYQNIDVLDVLLEQICRLKNCKTILISDNQGSSYSRPQYDIVLERFNKKEINYETIAYSGVDDLIDIISKSTFVITTKLHVGITAAALNKRVFSIYGNPKTKRFHRQIGNIYCLPLSESGKNNQELFRSFFESSTFSLSDELKQSALQNRKYLITFLTSIK